LPWFNIRLLWWFRNCWKVRSCWKVIYLFRTYVGLFDALELIRVSLLIII
jgi:hypothetical protein